MVSGQVIGEKGGVASGGGGLELWVLVPMVGVYFRFYSLNFLDFSVEITDLFDFS